MNGAHIRLALPRLALLDHAVGMDYVRLDRVGGVAQSGRLSLPELARVAGHCPVVAILHPDDAVTAEVAVPPLRASRLAAALPGLVETMALSPVQTLAVGHGPRQANGRLALAWADAVALQAAGRRLTEAGLSLATMLPHAVAVPESAAADQPLELPAGPHWQTPLPAWSLPWRTTATSAGARAWMAPLAWGAVALAVVTAGVQWEARHLASRQKALTSDARARVQAAFPQLPVVIDPLAQARAQRDLLLQAQGADIAGDFVPLAQAVAQVLPMLEGRVQALRYRPGVLSIQPVPGATQWHADTAARLAQASGLMLELGHEDDGRAGWWHIRRQTSAEETP